MDLFAADSKYVTAYKADVTPKNKDTNSPTGSWFKLNIPFGKSEKLRYDADDLSIYSVTDFDRFDFQRFDSKSIRIGKLLEILDLVAGGVSYDYCYHTPHDGYQTNVLSAIFYMIAQISY